MVGQIYKLTVRRRTERDPHHTAHNQTDTQKTEVLHWFSWPKKTHGTQVNSISDQHRRNTLDQQGTQERPWVSLVKCRSLRQEPERGRSSFKWMKLLMEQQLYRNKKEQETPNSEYVAPSSDNIATIVKYIQGYFNQWPLRALHNIASHSHTHRRRSQSCKATARPVRSR